jgi:hypothetical protein
MVKALTNTRKGEKMKNQKVRVVIVTYESVFYGLPSYEKSQEKGEK